MFQNRKLSQVLLGATLLGATLVPVLGVGAVPTEGQSFIDDATVTIAALLALAIVGANAKFLIAVISKAIKWAKKAF